VRRLLALAFVVLIAGSARAGIVILNSGHVFLGEVDDASVTSSTITLRRPRLGEALPGEMRFERKEVRWFAANADHPTDEYCVRFPDLPLDRPWDRYLRDYKERQALVFASEPLVMTWELRPTPISRRYGRCEVSIRAPAGWQATDAESLLVVESPDRRARIHVFASDLSGERALAVAHGALARLGNRFESEKATANGLEWLTKLSRKGRDRCAVRRILQTETSTAFAVAYASERDFGAIERLARRSLDTFGAREP
jgi:hypothetical protein